MDDLDELLITADRLIHGSIEPEPAVAVLRRAGANLGLSMVTAALGEGMVLLHAPDGDAILRRLKRSPYELAHFLRDEYGNSRPAFNELVRTARALLDGQIEPARACLSVWTIARTLSISYLEKELWAAADDLGDCTIPDESRALFADDLLSRKDRELEQIADSYKTIIESVCRWIVDQYSHLRFESAEDS